MMRILSNLKLTRYAVQLKIVYWILMNLSARFCVSRKVNRIEHSYQINDSVLPSVNKIKDLGVHITSNLDWTEHAYNVSKKGTKCWDYLSVVP
jgi:hypothetical protein